MDIRDNTKTFSGIPEEISKEIPTTEEVAEEYRKRPSVDTKGIEKTDQCKKCGARLSEGAAFCADCGNKLG
jgi:ribosomal protein L40E